MFALYKQDNNILDCFCHRFHSSRCPRCPPFCTSPRHNDQRLRNVRWCHCCVRIMYCSRSQSPRQLGFPSTQLYRAHITQVSLSVVAKRDYAQFLAVEANFTWRIFVAGDWGEFTSRLHSELKCPQKPQIRDRGITKTKTKINRYVEFHVNGEMVMAGLFESVSWYASLHCAACVQLCMCSVTLRFSSCPTFLESYMAF